MTKTKKRLLAALVCGIGLVASGCGGSAPSASSPEGSPSASDTMPAEESPTAGTGSPAATPGDENETGGLPRATLAESAPETNLGPFSVSLSGIQGGKAYLTVVGPKIGYKEVSGKPGRTVRVGKYKLRIESMSTKTDPDTATVTLIPPERQ